MTPNPSRDPETGLPPGSIGDLSARAAYDVRDLKMMGYSWDQIHDVAYGRITLDELFASKSGDHNAAPANPAS